MRRELVPGIELENMEDKFVWGGGGGGRDDGGTLTNMLSGWNNQATNVIARFKFLENFTIYHS